MNKLSALGIAGALLLGAAAPALGQSYPVDPGYDQGPGYGPPGGVEDLPPGLHYGPDPAYGGGFAGRGPDRGEGYVYGAPDGYPAYGDEDPRFRRPHYDHPRGVYGDDFRTGTDRRYGEGRPQRQDGGYAGDRYRPESNPQQQRRRPRSSDEDMSDQQ